MAHSVYLLPALVGVVLLACGAVEQLRGKTRWTWLEGFVAFGVVLFASPLGTFGAEHFVIPKDIASLVPAWLPARQGIAYFVGAALIGASLSFIFRKYTRLAALLTAIMFFSFVCLIHVPGALTHLGNRDYVIDALRDSALSVAAFTVYLRLGNSEPTLLRGQRRLQFARTWLALVVLAFGVLQIMHPQCSPGVPTLRTTPSWVPLPLEFGDASGMLLVVCGIAMFIPRFARAAAIAIAAWMIALTLFLYTVDIFLLPSGDWLLGVNYIFDTMLFGGAMLLLAQALPHAGKLNSYPLAPHRSLVATGRE